MSSSLVFVLDFSPMNEREKQATDAFNTLSDKPLTPGTKQLMLKAVNWADQNPKQDFLKNYELMKTAIHKASHHLQNNMVADSALLRSIIYAVEDEIIKSTKKIPT